MLARLLEAGREAQQLTFGDAINGDHGDHLRTPDGERAGLVEHDRVDLVQPLERGRVAEQHAGLGTAPHCDCHRHRRGEAERAGAGDHQGAHGHDDGVCEPGLRAEREPRDRREQGHGHDRRHEPRRDPVRKSLHRCPAALRLGHGAHDARKHRARADALGTHDERAAVVHCSADQRIAGPLRNGQRLTSDHGLVHAALTLEQHSVDGNLGAGTHAQAIAGSNLRERHGRLGTVLADAPGFRGREIEQCAQCLTGATSGAQLEHLPQQHERDDHGRRLEVDGRAPAVAEGLWHEVRRERHDHAVAERHRDAEADQREHVEAAIRDRPPRTVQQRPAAPHHDRRREQQLHPHRRRAVERRRQQTCHRRHFPGDQRHGEPECSDEAPAHVGEFRILAGPGHRHGGL